MSAEARAGRVATWLLPPGAAYLGAQVLYWAAADRSGLDYLLVATHARWDSGIYVAIARRGYWLARCRPGPVNPAAHWCGSAAWFPLYPLGMRLLGALGVPLGRGGLLLAEASAFASLLLVWWLLQARPTATNLGCLALAAVFPGSIYDHALFPVSLATAASLLFLGLLARDRWAAAGAAGAVAAAAYQTGVLLAGVVPVWLLWRRRPGLLARLGQGAATAGLVAAGLLLVAGLQQAQLRHWDGFLLVEARYGTGLHNPAVTFAANATAPRRPGTASRLAGLPAPRDQFLLVTGILLLGAAATVAAGRPTPLEVVVLADSLLFWLAPLVAGGHVAQYRAQALLLPSVLLLRRLPAPVPAILAAAAAVVAWRMAGLFYHDVLI